MNYYKQGDAANAGKIKAAFEKLGINVLDFGFADKAVVYCSVGECVQYLPYSINLMNILYSHPDYKELELPVKPKFKFKVGDWLYHNTLGVRPILVKDYSKTQGYEVECSRITYYLQKDVVENEYHLWTIADAKDGDVLVSGIDNPFIYNGNIEFSSAGAYVGVSRNGRIRLDMFPSKAWTSIKDVKPATKEQRDLLFAKMEEAGYQWDADKKELRKIQPHYDIANLHAGMPVLVRNSNESVWVYLQYSHRESKYSRCFNAGGQYWYQCIPFSEDTKHLLGTTDMCDEQYINW